MKRKSKKEKPSRSKRRGLTNAIENFTNPYVHTITGEPYDRYIRLLLRRDQSNEVYLGLLEWFGNHGKLTPQQIALLENALATP
jgi:hypothetical protein